MSLVVRIHKLSNYLTGPPRDVRGHGVKEVIEVRGHGVKEIIEVPWNKEGTKI